MNEIRHVVRREPRRRGRPRLSRDERRRRARAGRARSRIARRLYFLWIYLQLYYHFKVHSLVARIGPTAPDGPGPEFLEKCFSWGDLFPHDERAFSIMQSMVPRIAKLTRQGRPAELALEFAIRLDASFTKAGARSPRSWSCSMSSIRRPRTWLPSRAGFGRVQLVSGAGRQGMSMTGTKSGLGSTSSPPSSS